MSNEIDVRVSVRVRKDNPSGLGGTIEYQSSQAFRVDMEGYGGPSPGDLIIPLVGRDVYFTELAAPGLAVISNHGGVDGDSSHEYVSYGIYDSTTDIYFPLGELLPGETYVLRLARTLHQEFPDASGTGTTADENYLRFKAHGAPCRVSLNAFER